MCSICGMLGKDKDETVLERMNALMKRRGPDQTGFFFGKNVALGHNRLSVIDLENGRQPMSRRHGGQTYTIVYNGELYNGNELKSELCSLGVVLETRSDTELVLWAYILFGEKCPEKLNGIFAFAIHDEQKNGLFLCRDRLGVKPLYYAYVQETFLFASEPKALLAHPGIKPEVDREGIWELLFLSPCTWQTSGIYRGIRELPPATTAFVSEEGFSERKYWELVARPFTDTREEAIENVRFLVCDAVKRQLVSDVPLCTLLSGGLDSSVVTSVANRQYRADGKTLSTYSFEYEGNRDNFKRSLFQPESDDLYASALASELQTDHTVLRACSEDVYASLFPATDARDFPGQADIDSSLLYYCARIREKHTVALSGECSDEIFGGYPWFYRPEMLSRPFFPWLHTPMARAELFDPEFARPKEGFDFLSERYRAWVESIALPSGEDAEMTTSRIATQLSLWFFMQSLLERKDRMSMYSGLEVRVPFADHRIAEYVYNVPWAYKFENGIEKSLLRNAMHDFLPDRVLWRKKSPYPKTHDPKYEEMTRNALLSVMEDKTRKLHSLLDRKRVQALIDGADFTWNGQLMSKAQLYAWLLQMDHWMEKQQICFINS